MINDIFFFLNSSLPVKETRLTFWRDKMGRAKKKNNYPETITGNMLRKSVKIELD